MIQTRFLAGVVAAHYFIISTALAFPAVTTANVNLREGPGTGHPVVFTLPKGTPVDVGQCDDAGRWCAVTTEEISGFVSGRYLEASTLPNTVEEPTKASQVAPTTEQAVALELNESEKLSNEELEQLVAPIALHQDSLLSQILMASTYPLEAVEADRWVKANPDVKGEALETAMVDKDWDASIKALTAFPSALDMMNAELSWTQQLGDAFLAQQEDVLAAVQVLRKRAQDEGNLESNEHITYSEEEVITETGSTRTVFVAEPANTEVVYVPTYDPTVVYGTWPYPSYPPYYYYPPGYNLARGIFWFSVGYAIGNNLWGGCNWGRNNVNININNYNKNRYNKRKRNDPNWRHDPKHRKGVSYRNDRVAERHGGRKRDDKARARENYRGRADAGRRDLAKQPRKKPDQALRNQKRQAAAKRPAGERKAAGKKRQTAKKQPTRKKSQAKRQPTKSARKSSAYRGTGNGGNVQRYSNRGGQSRSANRSRATPKRSSGGRGGGGRGGGRRR